MVDNVLVWWRIERRLRERIERVRNGGIDRYFEQYETSDCHALHEQGTSSTTADSSVPRVSASSTGSADSPIG